MPLFFYSDITIQRYTLWALHDYMYGPRMHVFLLFFFLTCAFPLSQRYRIRFGSVTLVCGRKSCLPLSVLFFVFYGLRWDDNKHVHAITVPVYLLLLLSPNPGSKPNRLRIISGERPYWNVRVNGGVVCHIYYCMHASFQYVVVHNR